MFERYPIVGEVIIITTIFVTIYAIVELIKVRKFIKEQEQKNLEK